MRQEKSESARGRNGEKPLQDTGNDCGQPGEKEKRLAVGSLIAFCDQVLYILSSSLWNGLFDLLRLRRNSRRARGWEEEEI